MQVKEQIAVELRPWSDDDLPMLQRLMGDPALTEFLGGPESPEKILERHERYLTGSRRGQGMMFAILAGPEKEPAGMIGYWEHDSDGILAWETGWSVLREFHGQGVATQAARLVIRVARRAGKYRYLHAFSSVDNGASNAVCRKAGFELQGELDMDYPPGQRLRYNNWRIDLLA